MSKKIESVDNLKGYDKVIVTSALPYVNYEPHLGHLAGAVLSADVFSKYLEIKDVKHIFICGTDENGTTTEVTAKKEHVDPKALCDKYHEIHKQVYEGFEIDFTYFGRTTSKIHKKITQDIFLKLKENGYILEKKSIQPYCEHCKMELADRYIEGTCPKCGYEHANGSECEKCGALLDAKDLINPHCTICGNTPVFKESTHLYIDFPKLKPKLKEFIKSRTRWAENAVKFTENLIDDLNERPITRRINFGIPVPGYPDLVFYVWFDAPIGYISITEEAKEKRLIEGDWWKSNSRLVQFMGKDNIPFHTIFFPATLIGTGENWVLVDTLSSTEYLNYEGGKFSKSQRRGVFGKEALALGIEPDFWRFYLMYNRPEKSDAEFTWEDFFSRINNELVSNIVNFVYRTISLTNKYFGEIPEHDYDKIWDEVVDKANELDRAMDEIKIRKYTQLLLSLSSLGNRYLQENEPWKVFKENPERVKTILGNAIEIVKVLAIALYPITPKLSNKIKELLYLDEKGIEHWNDLNKKVTGKIKVERLFEKISEKKMKEFKMRFDNEFSRLELRVAKIIDVKPHPNADRLYVLSLDLGNEKRTLVAGLKKYYKAEELLGKQIVIIANLKHAKFRGIESEGMLLAAENDKGEVKVLDANALKPGERVYAGEELNNKPEQVTIEEFSKIKLKVKDGKVWWNDHNLKTKSGDVKVKIDDEETAIIR